MRRAAPLLVALCAAVTYANGVGNALVWDDAVVVHDGTVRDAILSPDEVASYWRPLTRASFVLDFRISGGDPRGFHLVNLALHAANATLLFLLGRKLFRRDAAAAVAAVLFAVHPIGSEAVNFVSARNNLLALAFMLGALLAWAETWRRSLASAAFFFVALLAKEPALMVLPLLAIFARRRVLLIPHAIAAVAHLAARFAVVGVAHVRAAPLPSRLAADVPILARYLELIAFPRELTIFQTQSVHAWVTALAWIALGVVAWLIARERSHGALFGALFLALSLLPIANVVPIPSAPIAERYFYIPAAGLFLALAPLVERWRLPVAVICVALAARTVVRNRDWHDDRSLAESAVRADPSSAQARFNLGVVLKDSGDVGAARAQWTQALALDPGNPEVLTQLGTDAAVRGDLATAESHYRRALDSPWAPPLARYDLALVCDRTGRRAEALTHYRAFLESARNAYGVAQFVPFAAQRVRQLSGP